MGKKIIQYLLWAEARLLLKKFHPKIIAVTGSVGKTSTKEAIAAVLAKKYSVQKSTKSYNSAWGVPLTILGLETAWHSPWQWILTILRGFASLLRKQYADVLVLEMGVDRPGDMDHMVAGISPFISVVTAVGEVPVHVEFFAGPKEVAFEKEKLVRKTDGNGWTVLNYDDATVLDMRASAKGNVITFGFGRGTDIRISDYQLLSKQRESGNEPRGISVRIDARDEHVLLQLRDVFGKQQAYVAAAALAVAHALGISLGEGAEALASYAVAPGRLRLIEGLRHSWILDDTYNASPTAMHAALDTLRDVVGARRIAVLGDMLEIGRFTIAAHQEVGVIAAPIVDILVTVGPRAKFIAQSAREQGMKSDSVFEFSSSKEAGKYVESMLREGDTVLVKGSQSMRMERAVEEIMAHPEQATQLLCRQEEYWKNKP